MSKRFFHTVGLFTSAALAFGALGCNGSDAPGDGDGDGTKVVDAPDFPDGTGQPSWNEEAEYPAATGYELGSAVPNFKFVGYGDYRDPAAGANLQYMKLADFYNPTGDGVFPDGHMFAGEPKPKALVIVMSSVWCGPCNQDAKDFLPDEYTYFKPLGGHIISVLIDGPTYGEPATIQHATNWANSYLSDWSAPDGTVYSLFIDPAERVTALFEPAFPSHLIVRTSDMKIMQRFTGVANQLFWQNFEGVINGTITEPIGG